MKKRGHLVYSSWLYAMKPHASHVLPLLFYIILKKTTIFNHAHLYSSVYYAFVIQTSSAFYILAGVFKAMIHNSYVSYVAN